MRATHLPKRASAPVLCGLVFHLLRSCQAAAALRRRIFCALEEHFCASCAALGGGVKDANRAVRGNAPSAGVKVPLERVRTPNAGDGVEGLREVYGAARASARVK
jgi:hypothetical protein